MVTGCHRCKWDGEGEHPCHYALYSCRKPAVQRWYRLPNSLESLAGSNMKFNLRETFACDQHWQEYTERYLTGNSNKINKLGECP